PFARNRTRTLALLAAGVLLASPLAARSHPSPSADRPLFDAMPRESWRVVGGAATFEVESDGALVGRGPIPRNGFLASPRAVADFRLVVDVRLGSAESPQGEKMNSGIQFRSRVADDTITGLQCEIDPTPRRWSGGVYDERGRGWLAPLAGNAAAQEAFRLGEWNRYEIECIGPRVRTRVNGVACAEWFDGTAAGLLAFQVHGGPACEVRFRDARIEELGAHGWRELGRAAAPAQTGAPIAWLGLIAADARGCRLSVEGSGQIAIGGAAGEAPFGSYAFDFTGAADAKAPHAVEVLWLDGAGAIVVDGRRVARFEGMPQPSKVVVRGADALVGAAEELGPVAAASADR
ncbi:MAG: DUF1080 domain-containing protein, partial [Planctomycetota bacterium]